MALTQRITDRASVITGSSSKRSFLTDGEETVKFSATISVSPSYANTVTQYPVEDGGQTSDHAREQADRLSVSASLVDDSATELFSLSRFEKRDKILEWRRKRKPLSFVTPDDSYENLQIEEFDPAQDEPTESINASLTFVVVRVSKASQRNIELPQSARPTNKAGRTQTQSRTIPGEPAPTRSLARSLF
jgi:hypothetical protein